ncbi:hypothetical protein V2J09_017461 [Rumex salicifolius]
MAVSLPPANFNLLQRLPFSSSMRKSGIMWKPLFCSAIPLQQAQELATERIMCDSCDGVGWLICDFCQGQKTNVKSESNRIYRRCPTCRAVGYILCTKCKVYKCVTFPDFDDSDDAAS